MEQFGLHTWRGRSHVLTYLLMSMTASAHSNSLVPDETRVKVSKKTQKYLSMSSFLFKVSFQDIL